MAVGEERVWMLPSCSATLADTLQHLEEGWPRDLTIPSPSLGHSLYKNAGVGWNELFQHWLPWVLVQGLRDPPSGSSGSPESVPLAR